MSVLPSIKPFTMKGRNRYILYRDVYIYFISVYIYGFLYHFTFDHNL